MFIPSGWGLFAFVLTMLLLIVSFYFPARTRALKYPIIFSLICFSISLGIYFYYGFSLESTVIGSALPVFIWLGIALGWTTISILSSIYDRSFQFSRNSNTETALEKTNSPSLRISLAFVFLYISLITVFASLILLKYVLLTVSGLIAIICIHSLSSLPKIKNRKYIIIHIVNNIYLFLLLTFGFLYYFGLNFTNTSESHIAEYVFIVSTYMFWIIGYYAQWRTLQTKSSALFHIIVTVGMQAVWILLAPNIISILEFFLE